MFDITTCIESWQMGVYGLEAMLSDRNELESGKALLLGIETPGRLTPSMALESPILPEPSTFYN